MSDDHSEDHRFRKKLSTIIRLHIDTVAGLFSGVTTAGLFNPWDRALYISVCERRPFLNQQNFRAPFHGFWQSVVQRTISGGLYFILQGQIKAIIEPTISKNYGPKPKTSHFLVGITAGVLNGMILNQLAVVKYQAWNIREGTSFWKAARHMYAMGGITPFFKGIYVTGTRDMVFGAFYEVVRTWLRLSIEFKERPTIPHVIEPPQSKKMIFYCFIANMIAAACATVASSPFNYARTIIYATPAKQVPPSTMRCLAELWREVRAQKGLSGRLSHLQQRLRVGWGTARVGVGMALGQQLYDWSKTLLEDTAILLAK